MERKITIDGKEYLMKTNGATPRAYRSLFHKDLFAGMQNAFDKDMQIKDSEFFENLAFCLAVQGGSLPASTKIDDWLEGMSTPMAIMNAAADMITFWMEENETTSTAKKE